MITTQPARPFLGPRPFQAGEKLYGRDYEARALLSMLIAERIVLLHSPSGAGKTSLIQAALIPMLEEREFHVLPTVRVGQEAPAGWAGNRYVRAMLLSLEEGRPADEQLPLAELESLTLAAYMARRAPAQADTVLVVDQFEEVLTRDPTDQAAKTAFFRELGEAMRARQIWALFVIREEYVATLEPYLRFIPTRLSSHFRLDLLGIEGALSALREPPRSVGVDFAEELAARLVDDLRRVNVQQADGSILQQLGPSVEPVQLQVVGLRLWERLPAGAKAITAAELDALGDVGTALGDYYAERVAAIAQATAVGERALRSWFDRELITPQGVRGQVLQGAGESAGLPNGPIFQLINAYLVRAELRRGATWFELAHDRLIAPVRASNAAWFAANLSTLQRQSDLWEQQGRPEGLLLRGAALAEAEEWATANAATLSATDHDFLELCRAAKRRAALLRSLSIGVAVAAVVALALAFVANSFRIQSDANAVEANQQRGTAQANAETAEANRQIADQQRATAEANARQARARELAGAAVSSLPIDPQRSLILAQAAYAITADAGEAPPAVVIEALEQAVTTSRTRRITITGKRGLQGLVLSPDGTRLATAGNDGLIRIFNTAGGDEISQIATNDSGIKVFGLAFSPDGKTLLAGTGDQAIIWSVADGTAQLTLDAHPDAGSDVPKNAIFAVAFSPDGKLLATGSRDGTARLWDARSGQELHTFDMGGAGIRALAFSPDGKTFTTGAANGQIGLWNLADNTSLWSVSAHQASITGLAFSPDGALLVSSSSDLTARFWNPASGAAVAVLTGHTTNVNSVTFSPDGKMLATTSNDGTARLWAVADRRPILTLAGHTNWVTGAVFRPDGGFLFTSSIDGSVRMWDLSLAPAGGIYGAALSPDGKILASRSGDGLGIWDPTSSILQRQVATPSEASALAYRPDGAQIAVGTVDGPILLIDPASGNIQATLSGHSASVNQLSYRADGRTLASASEDKTLRLWDTAAGIELRSFPEDAGVTTVAFSPDGALLASVASGVVTIRDATSGSGNVLQRLTLSAGAIAYGLAFSHDGQRIAAGDTGGHLAMWDVAEAKELARITLSSAINDMAFSPDDTTLAVAEGGRQVSLLETTSLTLTRALPQPVGAYTVAYRSDGRALVSAGTDGIARVFLLSAEDLLARAKERTLREPTADECKAYGQLPGCAAP